MFFTTFNTFCYLSLVFWQVRALYLPPNYEPFLTGDAIDPDLEDTAITLDQLNQVVGNFTCKPTQQFADECKNTTDALPFINQGFVDYNITSVGEKAAILSLMVFETGNFSFDKNHFPPPGRPGQGTRNLMLFPGVYEYAVDMPCTSSQALALVPNNTDLDTVSNDTKNAVRELVLEDHLSFASAMWFYTSSGPSKTGCLEVPGMVEGLQNQTVEGWENYITNCIFTTVTDERKKVWNETLDALNTVDCS
ncbi:hypothetical protein K435DRAFT_723605 [Dendrothele bispora CBS 962.96]|uniref:Uncharacterized protein n=1 Tax=Dendrothele bispora (strain CBS 962.96) TaxID=1314807 RepID=A0A4S8M0U4_DENBC|nr:hypothetical protein K435DRAFT_723605 [Dendrothele bispora CBS 962.96]